MSDLIERQAAYTTLTDYYHHTTEIQHKALREAFERVPSAETHEERTETHACDCISRQAAIDAILAVTGNSSVRELYEHVQEHGLSEMWSGGVNAAIDIIIALPSAQPEPHWIPCSERLPDEYGNYLISIKGEEPDIGTINPNDPRGWSLCDANGFYWANDKMLNIIAWMPLPEPYAERRTDE